LQSDLGVGLSHAGGGSDGGAGADVHFRERARVRTAGGGNGTGRKYLRVPAVVLLRRVQRSVRGGGEIPGRAPALGAPDEGEVPGGRGGVRAAVSHADEGLDPHVAADQEQRGPSD